MPDERAPDQVGRHARLEIRFGVRRGRTQLVHAYAEPPLRVGRVLPDGDGLHLILASSAPGIFGGDHFTQSILLEPGARVRLTSQSSLQVHATPSGAEAVIVSRYQVAGGASLVCEWDPLIPFPDSRLSQRIAVDAGDGAVVCWSDAFMAGREARGERWRFGRLSYELALRKSGRLAYLERHAIEPATRPVTARWAGADASYFGSAFICGRPSMDPAETHVRDEVLRDVDAAWDRLEADLMVMRLMSRSGVAFHRARHRLLPRG